MNMQNKQNNNNGNEDFAIRNLVFQEERYAKLLKEYHHTLNPSTLKEIRRMHRGLSFAWDKIRDDNK